MQSDHQRLNFQTIDDLWKSLLDKRKNYVPNKLRMNPTYRDVIKSNWDILGNQKEQKFKKPQNNNNNQPHPSPDTTINTTIHNTTNIPKHPNFTPHRPQPPLHAEPPTTKDIPLFKNIPFQQQQPPLPTINSSTTTNINTNPPVKPNGTTVSPVNPVHHHHLPPKQTEIHIKEKEPQQQQQQQPPIHTERPSIPYQDKPPTQIKQLPFNIINSSINHSTSSSNHINELGKKRQREMTKEQQSKKSDSKTLVTIDLNTPEAPSQHLRQEQVNHNTFQV